MNKYKFYIVIDKEEFAIEMLEEYAKDELAQDFLKEMQDTQSLSIGLENGDMIAINEHLTSNVYFKAKKV